MGKLSKILQNEGLIDEKFVQESTRWTGVTDNVATPNQEASNPKDIALMLASASSEYDYYPMHLTDMDANRHYVATMRHGLMTLALEEEVLDVPVMFGRMPGGDFLLPTMGKADIGDALVCPGSVLTYPDPETPTKVSFESYRYLYSGEQRCFALCTPKRPS